MSDTGNKHNDPTCPTPISDYDTIQLAHGSGGKLTNDLISRLFVISFNNSILVRQDDQAVLEINGMKLAFTTDSFVVDPIFFEGGDIGDLAVNGTINDIVMSGAIPLYLSCAMIIEEGLPLPELQKVVQSLQAAAKAANVLIVTGDTKVVNKGKGDKLFINTSGIGLIEHSYDISASSLQPGDQLIINGTVADHGMAVLTQREGLSFQSRIKSDTASLDGIVKKIMEAGGSSVHAMRDPTRGGVAATLNEFAESSQVGIEIMESSFSIKPEVRGACEMLGIDPLYVANEGKLIVAVAKQKADEVLQVMRSDPLGSESSIIGQVTDTRPGAVIIQTNIGGRRFVDMPVGEQLPRIC